MTMRRLVALAIAIALALPGQTRVDIQRQGKGTDFLAPPFAKPLRSGGSLPLGCTVNELFFLTTAAPGANIHVCHAEGQWASQGSAGLANVTILNDGTLAGTKATVNLVPGSGLSQIVTVLPAQINVQQSIDTAVLLRKDVHQSGTALLCASSSGSTSAYECGMQPLLGALTPGMVFHWIPDVSNTASSVTLSIDTLGPKPIRLADGLSNPRPGDLNAGRMYPVWYDGAAFRVFESPFLNSYQTVAGAQSGTGLFCDSSGGAASAYQCNLSPPLLGYLAGMVLHWRPDVSTSGGPITLQVNSLPARPLKLADGLRDPSPMELKGGHLYQVWDDGMVFRVIAFEAEDVVTFPRLQSGQHRFCPSGTSVDLDFQCQVAPSLTAYSTGMVLQWLPGANATGQPVTLNVNGLGVVAVKRSDGLADPREGDFVEGRMQPIWFDGVRFRLLNASPVSLGTGVAPACTVDRRGLVWFTAADTGSADTLAVCAKDETDTYGWRQLHD